MSIEIPGTIASEPITPPDFHLSDKNTQNHQLAEDKLPEKPELSKNEVALAMDALARAASIFNKRLKYYINEDIGRVIVKIVDVETDKVIKEIPPRELQRLIARLKETIGLLVDEKI